MTSLSAEGLKSCPLCGGEAKRIDDNRIACKRCGIRTVSKQSFLGNERLWNTRTPDPLALLVRCKPWLEDQRTIIAAIAENCEQKVILGKSYKEQLAELDALLADFAKAGVK